MFICRQYGSINQEYHSDFSTSFGTTTPSHHRISSYCVEPCYVLCACHSILPAICLRLGETYSVLCHNAATIYLEMMGETPETFLQLVPFLHIRTSHAHSLSPQNRVLLVLLWLRGYNTYHMLSALFNVCVLTIQDEIRTLIPVFLPLF